MMKKFAILLLLLCLPLSIAWTEPVAQLYSSEGTVLICSGANNQCGNVKKNNQFYLGETLRVGRHGRAAIKFVDGTLVRFGNNSSITFQAVKAEKKSFVMNLKAGLMHLFSRESKQHPLIETDTMTAAIHGTEFVVKVENEQTVTTVISGSVEGRNKWGSIIAHGSEQIVAKNGMAPTKALVVNPYNAAQWTFYYPAILSYDDYVEFPEGANKDELAIWKRFKNGEKLVNLSSIVSGGSWRMRMLRSMSQLDDKAKALAEVESDIDASASYFLYRSGLQLSLGEVLEAEKSLALAESKLVQTDSQMKKSLKAAIYAQTAVIALTNNKLDKAESIILLAEREDVNSPAVLLANSYIKQAKLDLKGASVAAKNLLKLIPNSAGTNLRMAEMALSFDKRKEAKQYIEKALEINPNDALAHTMFGFIALQEDNNTKAALAFDKALNLNPVLPLAHLGKGLTKIHDDNLSEGRLAIEEAVHLAPNVALYRSYLGKTFFEEDKSDLADEEFKNAIDLDANDPTPYLYRAFNNLARNRVVDALEDVENSIAKNDNRAIFRSELLLDRDEATRTANLAQIFNELGFSQAARVEAIKSVSADYTNFSAHRLLADSYDSIHMGKAQLSEDRTATLLSPLSFNVFNNTASDISINEYSALFEKNEHRTGFDFSGESYGDNYDAALFQTGRLNDFGYLVKGETDSQHGSKKGNYLRDDRIRTAFQYQLNADNRFVLDSEYIYIDEKSNALEPYSTKDSYDGADVMFGYHGKLDEKNHLLTQVAYTLDNDRVRDIDSRDLLTSFSSSVDIVNALDDVALLDMHNHDDVNQVQAGVEHIYDSEYISTIVGYEHIYTNVNRLESDTILYDNEHIFTNLADSYRSKADYDLHANTVYSYATGHLAKWADVTFGLGYTGLDYEMTSVPTYYDDTFHNTKPNWKAGLTLYPTESLTMRSGYFQGLASSALENLRTLEPTLVGGINQLYTDQPGTESENFGFGVDYKIPSLTYLGGEYIHRDLNSQAALGTSLYNFDFDNGAIVHDILVENYNELRDQDFINSYWYQVLSKRFTSTFDYVYSREHLNVDFSQETQRHTVAMGLKYFATNNLFAYGRGVWRQQDHNGSFYFAEGVVDFLTLDLGVGYRIPNRHGIIKFEILNILDEDFDLDQSLGFYEYIPEGIGGRLSFGLNY